MAITGHTGVDEVTHLVKPEFILAQVYWAVEVPYIYDEVIGGLDDLRGKNTATSNHPIRARGAVATSLADGDEFTYSAASLTQTTATAARYAHALWIDERSNRLSLQDEYANGLRQAIDSCRLHIDTAAVGLGASASNNNNGDNATIFDYSEFDANITGFTSTAKEATMAHMVLHTKQLEDLRQSMLSSQAALFASMFGSQQGQQIGRVGQGARVGSVGNTWIHTSDRVPAADTSGKGGFMCDNLALTLVDTLGFDPHIDRDYIRGRGYVAHCAIDYAIRINDQNRIRQIVSRTP